MHTDTNRPQRNLHAIASLAQTVLCAAAILLHQSLCSPASTGQETNTETPRPSSLGQSDDHTRVRQLIADLGHAHLTRRTEATKALIHIGARAMPEIRRALKSDDAEVRLRAELVAKSLEAKAAAYLRERGVKVSREALSASFLETHVTVAEMQQLGCLLRVRYLRFAGTDLSDELMNYVGALESLEHLNLAAPELTDKALEHVAALPALTGLVVSETKITGTGVRSLANIDSLETLILSGSQLSDDALADALRSFSDHHSLWRLAIVHCPVGNNTAAAIGCLDTLDTLTRVELEGTKVSDDALKELSALPYLTSLNMTDTQITDAGLAYLKRYPRLRSLDLRHTSALTARGIASLRDVVTLEAVVLSKDAFSLNDSRALPRSLGHVLLHWSSTEKE
jgi:internalin A